MDRHGIPTNAPVDAEGGDSAPVAVDADTSWMNRGYTSVFEGTERDHSPRAVLCKPEAVWTADVVFETVTRLRRKTVG